MQKILFLCHGNICRSPMAEFIMKLTQKIVSERKLTTLMVTHSMRQALDHGHRTVMLHQGRVIFDVAGEKRASMDEAGLIGLFHQTSGEKLSDDALLLS